jgi:hypothetical protein
MACCCHSTPSIPPPPASVQDELRATPSFRWGSVDEAIHRHEAQSLGALADERMRLPGSEREDVPRGRRLLNFLEQHRASSADNHGFVRVRMRVERCGAPWRHVDHLQTQHRASV